MAYTNSPLVTYTRLTKNRTSPRKQAIDTITIHCYVGQVTAKQGCDYFATTTRKVSSNYIVGKDGSIGLSVEEKNRSWCTSSSANDNRAITIEVACDKTHPYAVTPAAYEALIRLVADICKRNDIKRLRWKGDKKLIGKVKEQNMTVHRWFSETVCPGQYLYERQGEIAERVNALLGAVTPPPAPQTPTAPVAPEKVEKPFEAYLVRVTASVLNIRKQPTTKSPVVGGIRDKGVYTIVEEAAGEGASKWGKLKSGAGWISLDYAKKV